MGSNSVKYVLVQSLVSLKRNIWLSIASILTVTVSLAILGGAIFFLANTAQIAKTFESQVEIAVFLEDDINSDQVAELQRQVKAMEGVASVTHTTKEQAILDFQKSMGTDSLLEDIGGINPLPEKLTVKATDPRLVEGLASKLTGTTGVDKVRYGQGILEKLIVFTAWMRWIGIGVVAAFSFASFLLIVLNIRTNVNSREKEIQIMRLVGASKAFVRWPFIMEGLFIGLIGGIVAVAFVGIAYTWLIHYIITTVAFLPVVTSTTFTIQVLLIMIGSGMAMGILASAFSVRKFLHL